MKELRREYMLGILIAIGIVVGSYFNFIEPKIIRLKELDVKVREADKKISEAKKIVGSIEAKKRELENLQNEYSKLERKIPKTTRWDEVLRSLVVLTKKSGLKMVSARFEGESEINLVGNSTKVKGEAKREEKKAQKEGQVDKVFSRRINVDLRGRYVAFDNFVKNLVSSDILFSPYSVRVSSGANARDPELNINLGISMYRYQFGNETVKEITK